MDPYQWVEAMVGWVRQGAAQRLLVVEEQEVQRGVPLLCPSLGVDPLLHRMHAVSLSQSASQTSGDCPVLICQETAHKWLGLSDLQQTPQTTV